MRQFASFVSVLLLTLPACTAATAPTRCTFRENTAFMGNAALDGWHQELPMSSRFECCEVCRATPQCHVANFAEWKGENQGRPSNWNITGSCWMRGRVNASLPTAKANVTACLVASRPPPPSAPPARARNVLYIVSDDMRPQLPVYGQRQILRIEAARKRTKGKRY